MIIFVLFLAISLVIVGIGCYFGFSSKTVEEVGDSIEDEPLGKAIITFPPWAGLMNQYIHISTSLKHLQEVGATEAYLGEVIMDINTKTTQPASNLFDLLKIGDQYGIDLQDVGLNKSNNTLNIEGFNLNDLEEPLSFNENIINEIPIHIVDPDDHWVILHLKTGIDSISHYAKIFEMTEEEFEVHLRDAYTKLLSPYEDPKYSFYVCCPNGDDPIILKLKDTHTVISSDKLQGKREENAIRDLMTVKLYYTNADAAILPFGDGRGSTFARWLDIHCEFKERHYLDLDSRFWESTDE